VCGFEAPNKPRYRRKSAPGHPHNEVVEPHQERQQGEENGSSAPALAQPGAQTAAAAEDDATKHQAEQKGNEDPEPTHAGTVVVDQAPEPAPDEVFKHERQDNQDNRRSCQPGLLPKN